MKRIWNFIKTSQPLHLVFIFVISFGLWFWGYYCFNIYIPWLSFFADSMGELDNRENLFAPIGTFFSGLSAIATAYLIWLQLQTMKKHDLEVETERVISHFFILLDKHRTIVNNLKFKYRYNNGSQCAENYICIKLCIEIIRNVLFKYSYASYTSKNYRYITYFSNKIFIFIKNCNDKPIEPNDLEKIEYILSKIFEKLDNKTLYCLSQYFHNIYAMLKLLNENKNNINVEEYMRTLRAEFVQDEFLLIYYYAYSYKEKKFKNLIEETGFFHNLHKNLISFPTIMDTTSKKQKVVYLYDDDAFIH